MSIEAASGSCRPEGVDGQRRLCGTTTAANPLSQKGEVTASALSGASSKVLDGVSNVASVSPNDRHKMIRVLFHLKASKTRTGAFARGKKHAKVTFLDRAIGRRDKYNLKLIPSKRASLKHGMLPLICFDVGLGGRTHKIAIERRLFHSGNLRLGRGPAWLDGFSD
ncbi:MAG: hypothetical protein ACLPV8_27785 [Steroidobacteraceae bacterium]